MKSKIILLLVAFLSTVSIAQSKVGTIDSEYIVSLMPEAKIVLKRSQAYGAKLDSSFSIKVEKFQVKLKYLQDNKETLSDLMKKTKNKELAEMEADIKKYQQNGSQLLKLKQNELMRPLYNKLSEAIRDVSKANNFTQVLTITGNQFAYVDDKFDITKLVIDKLGIKNPE
jgi:outer membrane protein|tara:strand:+ start:1622 stop:2131 length:510 start_codon:yes stop_codon:yes gene_type:complete